jgi:hypothetical protein
MLRLEGFDQRVSYISVSLPLAVGASATAAAAPIQTRF